MNQQIYVESDVSRMFVAEYGMVVQQGYLLPALLEKYPDG